MPKPTEQPCFCGRPSSTFMVGCSTCPRFIHYGCSKISTVTKLDELLHCDNVAYICPDCEPKVSPTTVSNLQKSHDKVFWPESDSAGQRSQSPSPTFTDAQLEAILDRVTAKAVSAAVNAANATVAEMLEKQTKKHNLVAVGLPEKSGVDEIKQNELDKEQIAGYCKIIGVAPESVATVFRDGAKRQDRSRILKICFREDRVTERRVMLSRGTQLLRRDQELKDLTFKPFIREDLTRAERDRDYELRQEVKKKRNEGGDWIIRGGKVVQRHSNPTDSGN